MLLAWLAAVAGAVPGVRSLASPRSHERERSRRRRPPPPHRSPPSRSCASARPFNSPASSCAASRDSLLSVAGTVSPAERAWALAWPLLAATTRLHSGASAGRPLFGERDSATPLRSRVKRWASSGLLSGRSVGLELRADLTPSTLALDDQLQLVAPVLPHR